MDPAFENHLSTRDVSEELRTACGRGDIETVKSILSRGKQTGAKDHDGWAELSYSPRGPRMGLDSKPSPAPTVANAVWKRSPGTLPAYLEAKDRSGLTALSWAALKGRVEIAALLVEHGSDVEAKDGFARTPLMTAAAEGHTETVQYLAGIAQLNSQDDDGRTALALAASRGRFETAEALLNAGVDLEVADKLGYRALTWAAIGGIMTIVELLLDRECELEALDRQGLSPLVLAAMHGHDEIAHRLAAEGARVPLDLRDRYTQLKPVGRRPKVQQPEPAEDTQEEPAAELGEPGVDVAAADFPEQVDEATIETNQDLNQTGEETGAEAGEAEGFCGELAEATPEGEVPQQTQTEQQ
eukprot:gnl/MRDRNA2_/MRDRNA2_96962_c0_seq1.p1 gnl/MRDRNA2_/MRDRNA2_96962_c0~~gnl/MRDRNA2_/MRDRNA2_96962_c0_seq1.p1  ORF type:complete len:356 (+),score=88.60 gnl/MRDRNA2_/MRDRNA2_96962_c0_seq1:80-1147(+)